MNHVLSKTKQRSLLLVALLLMGCLQLLAQTRTIKGEVTDAQNGDAHTDWNDEVYRTAFGTDNNLSLAGSIGKFLHQRLATRSVCLIQMVTP